MRTGYVIKCLDAPAEQYRAEERQGCNKHYPVFTTKRNGQSKCPYCSKRTRYDANDNISMSAAIIAGPFNTRDNTKRASEIYNQYSTKEEVREIMDYERRNRVLTQENIRLRKQTFELTNDLNYYNGQTYVENTQELKEEIFRLNKQVTKLMTKNEVLSLKVKSKLPPKEHYYFIQDDGTMLELSKNMLNSIKRLKI